MDSDIKNLENKGIATGDVTRYSESKFMDVYNSLH